MQGQPPLPTFSETPMRFARLVAALTLATAIGATPVLAAEGAATGNGTSTPAGPAASGGMKKHHMKKMKHSGMMKSHSM
jgi:hypothetical protein